MRYAICRFIRRHFRFFDDDVPLPHHLIESHNKKRLINLKKFPRCRKDLLPCTIAVSFIRQLVQRIHNSASKPGKSLLAKAHLSGNNIRGAEADSPDVIRQAVGILLYNLDTLIPIGLVDLRGMGSRHVVTLQKEHNVLYFLLLSPALLNPVNTETADSRHLYEGIRVFFNDVQRVLAELLHDLLRKFRADPLDKP